MTYDRCPNKPCNKQSETRSNSFLKLAPGLGEFFQEAGEISEEAGEISEEPGAIFQKHTMATIKLAANTMIRIHKKITKKLK